MDKYNMSGIKISGLGALFTDDVTDDEIQEVEISRLKAFRNHPYRVLDNKDMNELVESIRKHGVLEAVICRKSGDGFEIISGHRRKRACELAGLKTVPVRILNVSDDEATVYMVDANLRRETVLFSEKAWAYRMKYEAIKHQGKKGDDKKNRSSLDFMAEEANESGTQIKRYIRLTYLQPNLLDMVDEGKIPFSVGTVLSYLDDKSQRDLLELLRENCKIPSGIQAEQIKNLCLQGKMNKEIMRAILTDCFIQKEEQGETGNEEPEKDHSAKNQQRQPSSETDKPEPSDADIEAFYNWGHFKTSDVITADDLKRRYMNAGGGGSNSLKDYKGSPRGVQINYKKELTYVQLAKRLKDYQEKQRIAEEKAATVTVGAVAAEDLQEEDPAQESKKEDLIPESKKDNFAPETKKEDPISGELKEDNYGVEDVKVLFYKYTKELEEYIEAECPEHIIQENKILVDALTLLLEQY